MRALVYTLIEPGYVFRSRSILVNREHAKRKYNAAHPWARQSGIRLIPAYSPVSTFEYSGDGIMSAVHAQTRRVQGVGVLRVNRQGDEISLVGKSGVLRPVCSP